MKERLYIFVLFYCKYMYIYIYIKKNNNNNKEGTYNINIVENI